MVNISLNYVQHNKNILDITCKYMLWAHSSQKTSKYLVKEESYKLTQNELKKYKNSNNSNKGNKDTSDYIINEMKDRYNYKLLGDFLKRHNIVFFVPLQLSSHKLYMGDNNIVIELCYYHNVSMYNIMYSSPLHYKKGCIMVPQGNVKTEMEKLYDSHRLSVPYKQSQNNGSV